MEKMKNIPRVECDSQGESQTKVYSRASLYFPTNGPPCITLSFWCFLSLQLAIKIVITGLYKHFCKHFFFLSDMLFLMFISLFLVCCTGFFSSCGKRGLLSSCGARASHWRWLLLLQRRGLRALRLRKLRLLSSRTQAVVVVRGLTCLKHADFCQIRNQCLLHQQADSLLLSHQGSPP